jgi:hypothetical protein
VESGERRETKEICGNLCKNLRHLRKNLRESAGTEQLPQQAAREQ